jgi:hypothetical protein
MPGSFVAAYIVTIGVMLFAGSCALTFAYVVRHLDPPADPTLIRPALSETDAIHEGAHVKVPA